MSLKDKLAPDTAFGIMKNLSKLVGGFYSTERPPSKITNSELRRWFQKGSIIINGKKVSWNDVIEDIESLVLHPKGKRKTTLY
jgi:hypothetical protein